MTAFYASIRNLSSIAAMRIISDRQRSLAFYQGPPSVTQEWNMIASILDANPAVSGRVWEDLTASRHGRPKKSAGAKGMTAEQVLRFAIVKMKEQLSYRDLRDRVADYGRPALEELTRDRGASFDERNASLQATAQMACGDRGDHLRGQTRL